MPVERRGHTTGAFLVPAPQIPALPGVGLHVVVLVSAVGTVIVQFDGQGFRVLDVVRLRRGGRRRLLWRPVGDGLRLVAVHPCLDGAVNVRVGEFVEFPYVCRIAVFRSVGCGRGGSVIHDAELHLALRAIHISGGRLAETIGSRTERNVYGLIVRPHLHAGGVRADRTGRLEVDRHLGLVGMLAGVGACEGHATAYGAVLHVDHGVADLRLVPPVTVRTVRTRAVGEVELRRREIRAFRTVCVRAFLGHGLPVLLECDHRHVGGRRLCGVCDGLRAKPRAGKRQSDCSGRDAACSVVRMLVHRQSLSLRRSAMARHSVPTSSAISPARM